MAYLQVVPPPISPLSVLANHPDRPYEVLKPLGQGSFGQVALVSNRRYPEMLAALKRIVITGQDREYIDAIRKEITIQESLTGHENVIQVLGKESDAQFCYMFLEYADGGDLYEKITSGCSFSLEEAHSYFKQLVNGLKFLHCRDVAHRDIKPENLMLTHSGHLKIADFGLATWYRYKGAELIFEQRCGSVEYVAPEIYTGAQYRGPQIDIWSAGVVLLAMLTRQLPWEFPCMTNKRYFFWMKNRVAHIDAWNELSCRAKKLLWKMLSPGSENRATIEEIQSSAWYLFGDVENDEVDDDDNLPGCFFLWQEI
ncbi:non-specific serine/threonine protein kinase [Caenorhabditis elegans]|uniref:non-specific serine/threonine protein kinase n=1 Tax=Caenorhabditis elegans TaxID=6239 RepID=O44546_CAEEL|nr:Protein kinase domain-containing protein [Caenorhabditis elegans]CCD68552.1 Protein kinase domain-containing protein [Caenorhabditis elegans]|eukprot:NP_503162.3 protein KINase [Caenorhabditis elegans]